MLKIQAIGHIGDDARIKNVNGAEFISFRIADNRSFKGDDGITRTTTTWISCTMDIARKGIVEYLTKGQRIYIEGYPTVRYSTNQQGEPQAYLNVYVNNVEFCSDKKE